MKKKVFSREDFVRWGRKGGSKTSDAKKEAAAAASAISAKNRHDRAVKACKLSAIGS